LKYKEFSFYKNLKIIYSLKANYKINFKIIK
jgi:hypothetical protein